MFPPCRLYTYIRTIVRRSPFFRSSSYVEPFALPRLHLTPLRLSWLVCWFVAGPSESCFCIAISSACGQSSFHSVTPASLDTCGCDATFIFWFIVVVLWNFWTFSLSSFWSTRSFAAGVWCLYLLSESDRSFLVNTLSSACFLLNLIASFPSIAFHHSARGHVLFKACGRCSVHQNCVRDAVVVDGQVLVSANYAKWSVCLLHELIVTRFVRRFQAICIHREWWRSDK